MKRITSRCRRFRKGNGRVVFLIILKRLRGGVASLSFALSLVLIASLYNPTLGVSDDGALSFYVAVDGSDEWSGTLVSPTSDKTDGPFATFERARDAIRELKKERKVAGAIIVEVSEGVYELPNALRFTREDGGDSDDNPVVWRAKEGDSVLLNAGRFLTDVQPLSDSLAPDNVRPEICNHLCVADLNVQQIGDLGTPDNSPELFFRSEPTRIARYPNDSFVKITGLSQDGTNEVDIRGVKGVAEGKFNFDDKEILKCLSEKDLWVSGYWFWDWSEQKHRVESIDSESMTMNVSPPYHHYGYRIGQWFYVFNALCELDVPGEYYIDRDDQKLYFYPPADDWKDGDFLITRLPRVVEFENVSNFVWSGFTMIGSRGDAVYGSNLHGVTVEKCEVYDVSGCGIVLSGTDIVVRECELWRLGRGGVNVSGGNRETLEPSGNRVVDNYIHDYALVKRVYEPGVSVAGVGNYVAHNLIENAPHMAVGFGGNENLIEFNEICNVCFESNDAGAIYTGRNWTMRGNVICGNYLHDIQGFQNNGCVGVYLDDMFSSAEISGNLFVNVTRAAFIGGGRDSQINDNVFVNCNPALHIDARGAGWARDRVDDWIEEGKKNGTLNGIKYLEEPYLSKYPKLASILDDEESSHYPEGCEVVGNVCIGGFWDVNKHGQWQGETVEKAARPYLRIENNFIAEVDDGSFFVDSALGDYRLRDDSAPVRAGFKSPLVSEMGLSSERMKKKAQSRRSQ